MQIRLEKDRRNIKSETIRNFNLMFIPSLKSLFRGLQHKKTKLCAKNSLSWRLFCIKPRLSISNLQYGQDYFIGRWSKPRIFDSSSNKGESGDKLPTAEKTQLQELTRLKESYLCNVACKRLLNFQELHQKNQTMKMIRVWWICILIDGYLNGP